MTDASSRVAREAPAKLNLRLRVLQQDRTGYHGVETLLLQLDLADEVLVAKGPRGIRLEVEGDDRIPADESNLCWKAAEAFYDAAGMDPCVDIRLEKRIPAAAGLGGGSADAAAVLESLNAVHGTPLDRAALVRIGGSLGSDVPFGLAGSSMALGWERGRRLLPLTPPPSRPVLIAIPPFGVAAADAYGWLASDREAGTGPADGSDGGCILPAASSLSTWAALAPLICNDLEPPVLRRHPELGLIRDALLELGSGAAFLCGSGSCVAAIFDDDAIRDLAADEVETAAGVPTIRTTTRGPTPG